MTLKNISILSVPVSDQRAAKEFYTEVLGFTVVYDEPMDEGRRWVQLGLPQSETSVALVTWLENMPAGGLQGVVINTDDIQNTRKNLKERGLEITEIEQVPWGQFATFNDPDGNGWILQQPPESMPF